MKYLNYLQNPLLPSERVKATHGHFNIVNVLSGKSKSDSPSNTKLISCFVLVSEKN